MTSEEKEKLESEYFRSYTDLRKYKHQYSDGEIAMRWIPLTGKMVPQIQAFDDSWKVLACFSDLIDKLAEFDGENITPDKFIEILESLGFINTDSYKGDFIPNEMFESYQTRRKRDKKLNDIL